MPAVLCYTVGANPLLPELPVIFSAAGSPQIDLGFWYATYAILQSIAIISWFRVALRNPDSPFEGSEYYSKIAPGNNPTDRRRSPSSWQTRSLITAPIARSVIANGLTASATTWDVHWIQYAGDTGGVWMDMDTARREGREGGVKGYARKRARNLPQEHLTGIGFRIMPHSRRCRRSAPRPRRRTLTTTRRNPSRTTRAGAGSAASRGRCRARGGVRGALGRSRGRRGGRHGHERGGGHGHGAHDAHVRGREPLPALTLPGEANEEGSRLGSDGAEKRLPANDGTRGAGKYRRAKDGERGKSQSGGDGDVHSKGEGEPYPQDGAEDGDEGERGESMKERADEPEGGREEDPLEGDDDAGEDGENVGGTCTGKGGGESRAARREVEDELVDEVGKLELEDSATAIVDMATIAAVRVGGHGAIALLRCKRKRHGTAQGARGTSAAAAVDVLDGKEGKSSSSTLRRPLVTLTDDALALCRARWTGSGGGWAAAGRRAVRAAGFAVEGRVREVQ
ncbi:hypothetical protein C8R44DRAFT_744518 [Mycena epipterygia]|nr:hypothetical protein C8R44DRAFT_744518 [Mycena epipterygia]